MSVTTDLIRGAVIRALEAAETPADLEAFLDGLGVPANATITVRRRGRRITDLEPISRAEAIDEALDVTGHLDELRTGKLDDEPARWRHAEEDRLVDELNTLAGALLEASR